MTYIYQIEVFKYIVIISPFVAAFIAARLTYFFSIKSKKFDILYANKIPAFKNINEVLIEYKMFCLGRVAFYEQNEFSPYWTEEIGVFEFRKRITQVYEKNSVFISQKSRKSIEEFIKNLSLLCNIEIQIADEILDKRIDLKATYQNSFSQVEKIIEIFYKELNLK